MTSSRSDVLHRLFCKTDLGYGGKRFDDTVDVGAIDDRASNLVDIIDRCANCLRQSLVSLTDFANLCRRAGQVVNAIGQRITDPEIKEQRS